MFQNRRSHFFIFFCVYLLIAPVGLLQAGETKRPNIVLIISDDHGTDALGSYGNPVIKTPHLDRLAESGIRFTNAFGTTASCSPSRSVILTGLQNHANGQYGLSHDFHNFKSLDHIKSLPYYLKEAGYRTVRIGKFHIAPEKAYEFETVLSAGAANDMRSIARSPVEMAEACSDVLNAKDDRPFFLYYCTDDPHRGLPFKSWPGPNPFGNRAEGYPGAPPLKYDPDSVIVPDFLPDTPAARAELAQYYQSVSRLDNGIGKLVELLKKSGKYANTAIIYLSDNGVAFPGAKTTVYDPGINLPLIVRLPKDKSATHVSKAMVSWTDITPTILDLAGATPEAASFHGRSFKNILGKDKDASGWDEVYASHTFHEVTMYYPLRMVRTSKYKLIWNLAYRQPFPLAWDLRESSTWRSVMQRGMTKYGKRSIDAFFNRPEFELYNLETDGDEIVNLASDPKYQKKLTELQNKILQFQKRTRDPWMADGN